MIAVIRRRCLGRMDPRESRMQRRQQQNRFCSVSWQKTNLISWSYPTTNALSFLLPLSPRTLPLFLPISLSFLCLLSICLCLQLHLAHFSAALRLLPCGPASVPSLTLHPRTPILLRLERLQAVVPYNCVGCRRTGIRSMHTYKDGCTVCVYEDAVFPSASTPPPPAAVSGVAMTAALASASAIDGL